jgi:predicted CopG family antitoxin
MAVKTITIDMDAYDALRRRKRAGQSFSDVIKEHFGTRSTGESLRRALEGVVLDESTLDALDEIVDARSRDIAKAADL